jgi:hypothetical protein
MDPCESARASLLSTPQWWVLERPLQFKFARLIIRPRQTFPPSDLFAACLFRRKGALALY